MTYVPPTFVTVTVTADDVDGIEATDAVVGDHVETVDIGGWFATYLRVSGPDLVLAADALHRLADRIVDTVLDARQARAESERHDCRCGARIDRDEETCGSTRCEQDQALDCAGLIP